MNRDRDTQLRLAALRHPASGATGSVHFAQYQLEIETKSFLTAMAHAHKPGAQPLPPPAGHEQWPRQHPARRVAAWPVLAPPGSDFEDWLGTDGQWWRLRYTDTTSPVDAFPLGSPIVVAADLHRYRDALDELVRTLSH